MVMPLVPNAAGLTNNSLAAHLFGSICGEDGESAESHAKACLELQMLGRLLAADILLNNFDRLPAIWDNEGNAGNLLVASHASKGDNLETDSVSSSKSCELVVIDTA